MIKVIFEFIKFTNCSKMSKSSPGILKNMYGFVVLIISMAGFVPKNATLPRAIVMLISLGFAYYLSNYQPFNSDWAITYFLTFEILYVGFITIALSKNGLRLWFIKKWGEEHGYLAFEAILGFLFFHNGVSIGYIASSTPGNLYHFIPENLLLILVAIMFVFGFLIKILAAKAVTIEIYYWKDMFLGRKISDFVVSGPYKYFKNPMYGLGQLQAYAMAIWYGSTYGLTAAFLNQALIFTFYYLVETEFIKRVYIKEAA
jgi:protein-S-isoprenylcysteine O-methyltransferase Ste14